VERLLATLERRFGRYAPGNLTYVLVAAQVVGLVLGLTKSDKYELLFFDIDLVRQGQIWRLISWLALPPMSNPGAGLSTGLIWVLFSLYWLYWMGTSLESEWGAFKFFVYWLLGVIGTIAAAAISHGPAGNWLLLLTLFLAFATLWPDFEIRLFFFVPVKVKWLAFLDGAYLIQHIFSQPGLEKLLPLVAVGNYLLFFGGTLLDRVRGIKRVASRASARSRMQEARAASALPKVRRCAICGASNEDPEVDLRVCSCEKCGGVQRDLCLPHVRNH
jgi:hypothetical protein